LSLDIHSEDTSKILTGGNDKNATVFNKDTEQIIAVLKGHTKKVTRVIYHPNEVKTKINKILVFFYKPVD
jgi:pre-mRNA-processing factor 19